MADINLLKPVFDQVLKIGLKESIEDIIKIAGIPIAHVYLDEETEKAYSSFLGNIYTDNVVYTDNGNPYQAYYLKDKHNKVTLLSEDDLISNKYKINCSYTFYCGEKRVPVLENGRVVALDKEPLFTERRRYVPLKDFIRYENILERGDKDIEIEEEPDR